MDLLLYFIRDKLSGTYYFIYAFILSMFMFAIIGYLLKEKYGKLEIKLATSQDNANKDKNVEKVKESKLKRKKKKDKKSNGDSSVSAPVASMNSNNNLSMGLNDMGQSIVNNASNLNNNAIGDTNLTASSIPENSLNQQPIIEITSDIIEPMKKVNPTSIPNPTNYNEPIPEKIPNIIGENNAIPKPIPNIVDEVQRIPEMISNANSIVVEPKNIENTNNNIEDTII